MAEPATAPRIPAPPAAQLRDLSLLDPSVSYRHSWGGTHDPAAALAVPAAIAFQDRHGWPEVRDRGSALAARFQDELVARYGVRPLHRGDRTGTARWSPCPCPFLPDGPPRSSACCWTGGGSRYTSGPGARTP